MITARPKVAELVFQLYSRSLHPELFVIHQSRTIKRGDYELQMDITSAGHVITWRYDAVTLSEVCTSAHHPLPQRRRLMNYQLKGKRRDLVDCRGGIVYQSDFQLEEISSEWASICKFELAQNGPKQGLIHQFDSSGRIKMGAVSYMNAETRSKSVMIQAFHTFPEDNAMVKTETVFKMPG
ncbi:MAG: DUF2617 domain-containing protein [Blastopirellula sp.]|nr:MAG: DUF2617 domain-containing protein [Blastopirellula sp.]